MFCKVRECEGIIIIIEQKLQNRSTSNMGKDFRNINKSTYTLNKYIYIYIYYTSKQYNIEVRSNAVAKEMRG